MLAFCKPSENSRNANYEDIDRNPSAFGRRTGLRTKFAHHDPKPAGGRIERVVAEHGEQPADNRRNRKADTAAGLHGWRRNRRRAVVDVVTVSNEHARACYPHGKVSRIRLASTAMSRLLASQSGTSQQWRGQGAQPGDAGDRQQDAAP